MKRYIKVFTVCLLALTVVVGLGVFCVPSTLAVPAPKELTIMFGGKESLEQRILPTIERFEALMEEKKTPMKVKLIDITGIPAEGHKIKMALDLKAKLPLSVFAIDHFWVPEFAAAGLLLDLTPFVTAWPDWKYYTGPGKEAVSYDGKVYGVLDTTDVRMLFYNKNVLKAAGIPVPFEPKSWDELLDACRVIKTKLPDVSPIAIQAGTTGGEETTMQGFLMLYVGAGGKIYDDAIGKWVVDEEALLDTLNFYKTIYIEEKLGPLEPYLVKEPRYTIAGELFTKDKLGFHTEGPWMIGWYWDPKTGVYPWPEMEEKLGWCKMPGRGKPGDPPFATVSGGYAVAVSSYEKNKEEAFEFLKLMFEQDTHVKYCAATGHIAPRMDALEVPEYAADEMLKWCTELLPYSGYRPGFPVYSKVSYCIQLMTERVISGEYTPEQAIELYKKELTELVSADRVVTR